MFAVRGHRWRMRKEPKPNCSKHVLQCNSYDAALLTCYLGAGGAKTMQLGHSAEPRLKSPGSELKTIQVSIDLCGTLPP